MSLSAGNFSVKIKLKSHDAEVMQALHDAESRILEMWGILAQGYATGYAPVDTGNLRASIGYKTDESDNTMYVGTNVEYAPYQEFGTYKMAAHPYLRPALEDHLAEYEDIMMSETAKEMNKP